MFFENICNYFRVTYVLDPHEMRNKTFKFSHPETSRNRIDLKNFGNLINLTSIYAAENRIQKKLTQAIEIFNFHICS